MNRSGAHIELNIKWLNVYLTMQTSSVPATERVNELFPAHSHDWPVCVNSEKLLLLKEAVLWLAS